MPGWMLREKSFRSLVTRRSSQRGCGNLDDSNHPALIQYSALGVTLKSALALPLPWREGRAGHEAVFLDGVSIPPDLDWNHATPVARIGNQDSGYEIRRAGDSSYVARFGRTGALRIHVGLGRIEILENSAALRHIAVNLGLAMYLVARGECVLHAAAFSWQGHAHALIGRSRTGKSTLNAILCWSGALAVSDDTLRARLSPDESLCFGGTVSMRLRPSASELAVLTGTIPTVSLDGRTVLTLPTSTRAQEPLASIWFANYDSSVTEPELVPLSRSQTFQRLIDGIRIRGLIDPSLMQRQLSALATLGERLPAFEARVPCGPPFKKMWGERLLAQLSSVGNVPPSQEKTSG